MSEESSVRLVADVHAVLGEGPLWVAATQSLWWVDIKGRKLFRLRSGQRLDEWPTPFRIGSIAPRESGGFIAGTEHGFAHVDPEVGRFELLFDPEEDRPSNRFNDGKVDRQGRFFVEAAKAMIAKGASVNGGFFVCPTFNELILAQRRIGVERIERGQYVSLASPQAVEEYEKSLAVRA